MKRHKYVLSFAIVAGLGLHAVNHGVNAQKVGAKDTEIIEHSPTFEHLNVSQSQTFREVVEAAPETIEIPEKKQLTIT